MKAARQEMPIEVEAQSLDQVDEALAAGADIILLDNLSTRRDQRGGARGSRGRAKIEISGGVTLDRMPELATTGADYVSVGALTHSAPAADLELRDRAGCLKPLPGRSCRRPPLARDSASAPRAAPSAIRRHYCQRNGVDQRRRRGARRARRAAKGPPSSPAAQTAGRGRLGPRVVLAARRRPVHVGRLPRSRRAAPLLTLAGGVAVADGIRAATGLPLEIKWPNDVVASRHARRARRKLAGILAEGSTSADGLQHVVLGFGINLTPAAYPPELADRASSIETELGRPVDGGPVLAEMLVALADRWPALAARRCRRRCSRGWRALAPSASGAAVEWETPRRTRARHRGGH